MMWLGLVLCGPALAQAPADDGLFYYRIGGGEPLTRAPHRGMRTVTLGGSVEWGTPFACGASFDPMAAVSNQLNGLTEGFQQLMGSVIQSATGAVASLPAIIIARANPDLYDLLQKGVVGAKTDIAFAQATCEDMQAIMTGEQGIDFEKWIRISALEDWRRQMESEPDVIRAKRTVDAQAGNAGTRWIGGIAAGGRDQPVIAVNHDIVIAGYNTLLNRGATDRTEVPPTSPLYETPLVRSWHTPEVAALWSVEVLGDTQIRTCEGCDRQRGVPGQGLVAKYEAERERVQPLLEALVAAPNAPTAAQLAEVSAAPGIALARTMERAMHLRRIFQSGRREAHAAANGAAQAVIRELLSDLRQEMDGLLYELTVRERIAGSTPVQLLERLAARRVPSSTREPAPAQLQAGAVQ
jgi:integrating conjugative element protein (TIGR03755 family)